MILRLFLVPALIVAGLVLLFLAGPTLSAWFSRVAGRPSAGGYTPEQFLRSLDDPNPEVRWRAASDLAQVLLRDDGLASDADFALELAGRLQRALADSAPAEKEAAPRLDRLSWKEGASERARLEPQRNYIMFLGACLGNFMVPVGAPLLRELAVQEGGLEARALAERRRRAVLALATLGENLKRFDRLAPASQDAVLAQLEAAQQGEHPDGARLALDHLRRRRQGRPDALGVDRVLVRCAAADDPSLRELAAFAMNFWEGTAAENARMEKALVELGEDTGRGEDQLARLLEENEESATRSLVQQPGFRVRANAGIALARRGSPRVRLDLLRDMLDLERLRGTFVLEDKKTGAQQPDEALAALTVTDTLKALIPLRRKRPELDLSALAPAVERLTQDPNPAIQAQAGETQLQLRGAP
jgi:hypothetical protein